MKVVIKNDQTNNKELYFEENFWTGKRVVKYNNIELSKISRNVYELKNGNDIQKVTFKGNILYGLTMNLFNNQIQIKEPLKWYEILLSVLVFVPCVLFGAIGGGIGGGFAMVNIFVINSTKNIYLKIILSIEFMLLALLLSYMLASVIFKAVLF